MTHKMNDDQMINKIKKDFSRILDDLSREKIERGTIFNVDSIKQALLFNYILDSTTQGSNDKVNTIDVIERVSLLIRDTPIIK